jgi:hypothetical protein
MASGVLFATGFDWLPDHTVGASATYGWSGGNLYVSGTYKNGAAGKGGKVDDTWNGFVSRPHVILASPVDHVVLQFGYRPAGGLEDALWVQFLANSSTTVQCDIYRLSNGGLQVKRGSTVLGTTAPALMTSTSAWYGIEIRAKFDNSAGELQIVINGTSVLSLTGIDTQDSAYGDCTGFALNASLAWYLDDVVFRDYAANASLLGYMQVKALMPAGTGDGATMTPSAAVANWTCVDEIPSDDDTTYVESSTPGDKDTYAIQDHGLTAGQVLAVQTHHVARRTDGASRQFQSVLRYSGSEATGATQTLGSSYAPYSALFDDCPGTTGWTLAQLAALKVGQVVIA